MRELERLCYVRFRLKSVTICELDCNTYQYYHYVMKNEIWKCTTSQLYATCAFTVTVYLERLEERRKEEK